MSNGKISARIIEEKQTNFGFVGSSRVEIKKVSIVCEEKVHKLSTLIIYEL